jgi:hypothetical protein
LLFGLAAVLLATASPSPTWAADRPGGDPHPHHAEVTSESLYGPITLPPAVGDQPGRFAAVVPYTPALCSNCYLTGVRVDLVYQDGSPANLDSGVMLHHLVVFNSGQPDATCPPNTPLGSFGQRFFASGNERTGGALPPGFGYHLGTDPVRTIIDLMNHSSEPKVVSIKATVTHVPDSTPDMAPVTPVWLDENNCGTSEYAVPAGPSHQVWRWTSTITGRVVAAGGHVHDGGIKTVLSNETTGQHLCTSYAGYGRNPAYMGSVESMTTCIHDRLGTVRAGEVLALDTYYDVPQARNGVMGIMIAYVYETADLGGGAPPPAESAPAPAESAPPPSHHH